MHFCDKRLFQGLSTHTVRHISTLPSLQLHFGHWNSKLCLKDLFDFTCRLDSYRSLHRKLLHRAQIGIVICWALYGSYSVSLCVVLTDCTAFLQYQLYSALSVLHPEVEHAGLTFYNVSRGGDAGAKCRSRGWWRRGGWRRRGGGGNCTSCCCIGCFWLAWRSVHTGLARLAGKVTVQRWQGYWSCGRLIAQSSYLKISDAMRNIYLARAVSARQKITPPTTNVLLSFVLFSLLLAQCVTHVSHNTVNNVFFLQLMSRVSPLLLEV